MSFDNVLRVNSSVVGLLSVVTMSLSSCFRDFNFSRYGHDLSSKLVLGTSCKMLLLITQRSLSSKGSIYSSGHSYQRVVKPLLNIL